MIAWVEDDPFERTLVHAAVTAQGSGAYLHLAQDGNHLLAELRAGVGQAIRPDIVFVNLETNRPGGVDLVRVLKEDPRLRRIPVIGYARPCERELLWEAYGAGANACLITPESYGDLRRMVQGTLQFWLSAARLPSAVRIPAYPVRTRAVTGTYGSY